MRTSGLRLHGFPPPGETISQDQQWLSRKQSKQQEGRTENAKQTKKNNLGGNNRKEHLAGAQAPDLAPESPATKTQPESLPLFLGPGHQEQEPEEPDPKTTTPEEQIEEEHLQHNHTRTINAQIFQLDQIGRD